MKSNPVGWFEIPTTDLERAKGFYSQLFDVVLTDAEMGSMKMAWFPRDPADGPQKYGATGSLVHYPDYKPGADGPLIYFTAEPSVEEVLKKAEELGATVTLPKTPIGEHGFIAHLLDTEGNKIAIHSTQG